MKRELTIIIPVYNEGMHLQKSLYVIREEVLTCMQNFEFLIIDDGSNDQTWSEIQAFCSTFDRASAIRLSRNFGKELALCAGLEHADGNAVIVMDADLQHPPELIPELIRLWKESGYEIVECVKTNRGKESWRNKWGSRFFYFLLNRLSGNDLRGASDFKLLDEKVIQAWRTMPENNTFFRGMTAWLGFKRTTIGFEVPVQVARPSRWRLLNLVGLAVNAVVSFSSFPLRVVSLFGLLFLIGSVALGIQTLHLKMIGEALTGFTTVILLLLIIGSVIMISLGIIGEYIAAIYNETKGRPRYIIGQTIMAKQSKESFHE